MLEEMTLPSGAVVLIDGDLREGPRDVRRGTSGPLDITTMRQTMLEYAEALVEPWKAMACDTVELEFWLGLELTTGRVVAFLAGAKGQGGVKVRIVWSPPKPESSHRIVEGS